jgi:hypothetical protein
MLLACDHCQHTPLNLSESRGPVQHSSTEKNSVRLAWYLLLVQSCAKKVLVCGCQLCSAELYRCVWVQFQPSAFFLVAGCCGSFPETATQQHSNTATQPRLAQDFISPSKAKRLPCAHLDVPATSANDFANLEACWYLNSLHLHQLHVNIRHKRASRETPCKGP